ncbi:MAG TPA: hypothetical protein VN033_02945 [Vulgatibacter sp.]|nr:hypothetical protein [Vulgatibacter sp.]
MKRRLAAALAIAALLGAGCATYTDRNREARLALQRGDLAESLAKFNALLGVESSRDLPERWGSETALTVLERATVLQAKGEYGVSARDYTASEKELELLDLANDTVGSIGQYVYSDDATRYKTTPTEKLLLNAFNMVNYLAMGDLSGARVEARRFEVMRRYLRDWSPEESHGAFGAYLAGFVAERSGEPDVALRYYDEVLAESSAPSLHDAIRRLALVAPYRTPRLKAVIDAGPPPASAAPPTEILFILKTGAAPHKQAKRIPVGLAMGLASNYVTGDTKVLEYGALKFVSYPELIPSREWFRGASVRVDGAAHPVDRVTDISKEIVAEYEKVKPKIIGSALTRLIVRAASAEAARAAGSQQSRGLGLLAAMVVEGSMVALDTPDTRSWSTLPARVELTRIQVPPGTREVEIELYGRTGPTRVRRQVEVGEGGFAVVDLTTLR